MINLGRLVIAKNPEVAERLLPLARAFTTEDLARIPDYFIIYCSEINIDPAELKKTEYDRDIRKKRSLFFSCMLEIYNHNLFYLSESEPVMKRGFVKKISDCTGMTKGRISASLRQTHFEVANYEDFRMETQDMIKRLKVKIAG